MTQQSGFKRTYPLILVGLLVPCLLISIPAILAYQAERRLSDSFHWVSHTLEVQRQLQRLLSLVVDAETGARGFLLTSREEYLAPYHAAREQLPSQIAMLHALTVDNPTQQGHLRQLDQLMASKLDTAAETIALQQGGDHEAALKLVNTDRGKQTMDAIRARIERMEHEESRLLAIRQELLTSHARFSTGLLCVLVVLNLFFAVAVLILFRRLSKLKHLVTICAWSRTVEYENEWLSFEEYLLRRFNLNASHGISPVEAEKAFGPSSRT
jgi:CHASE3 domain sensor protein